MEQQNLLEKRDMLLNLTCASNELDNAQQEIRGLRAQHALTEQQFQIALEEAAKLQTAL